MVRFISQFVSQEMYESAMSIPMTSSQVLDREFLEMRAKTLELAACLDRLQRADGSVAGDARVLNLQKAIQVLASGDDNRAEQIQQIFSRVYDPKWRDEFARQANETAAPT